MKASLNVFFAVLVALLFALPTQVMAQEVKLPDQVVSLFTELGAGLEAAGTDCDKVAVAITTWSNKNADTMKTLGKKMEEGPELSPEEQVKLEEKLAPAMEKLFGAAMQCAEHEGTQKAFEAMDKLMGGAEAAPQP
ncbi:MAG: hypothetical protein AUK47_18280 [Deltaproteobacteria bacterium CG2_30_63_29]|nr:MAG: hypothetical protein AUK47_18280 [Deltaproteobacteria bacterium CG2_30_63_29]